MWIHMTRDKHIFPDSDVGLPGRAVKLKGEDDVICIADLTNEAPLGAKVTVVHVLRAELNQRLQVRFIMYICYL